MTNNTKRIPPIVLKNVHIVANRINGQNGKDNHPRNFSGIAIPPYNPAGERNFVIRLDPEQVDIQELIDQGWNIKKGNPNPNDPDAIPPCYLRVKVRYFPKDEPHGFARMNPRIIKISGNDTLGVDENNVGSLDNDEINYANMTISGRWSESPTYTGVTAYLAKMVVYLREDDDDLSSLID